MQVCAVQPGANEALPCGRLRLRDLIFVMWEDEINAAGVQVKAFAEITHAHRRALQVPTWSPCAD